MLKQQGLWFRSLGKCPMGVCVCIEAFHARIIIPQNIPSPIIDVILYTGFNMNIPAWH